MLFGAEDRIKLEFELGRPTMNDEKYSGSRYPVILLLVSGSYFVGARGIVSVVCSLVL